MNSRRIILSVLLVLLAVSCKKPYTPPQITTVTNYLVVEGQINTGGDSTVIKLSRTVNISSAVASSPELNAQVAIQDDQNKSYTLQAIGIGVYATGALNLDPTHKYRLNINTSDGKNYVSDFVAAKASPPIDSVGFTVQSNGIQLYVNTHDPNNNTHYYRWDFVETWLFDAYYESIYYSTGDTILPRLPQNQIYQCWTNDLSDDIILGSSAKLTKDVIYQGVLTQVPSYSEKIEDKYSILVKQYALTSDAYNYFTLLKKNTEQLGSIFDAQPSQLTGNVHCTSDPTIPAIGYIAAGSVALKRIFIQRDQLPAGWRTSYPYSCQLDSFLYYNPKTKMNDVQLFLLPKIYVPVSGIFSIGPAPIGYTGSSYECGDCTIRGTTVKPSFWQ
jgi:hypothetical protein